MELATLQCKGDTQPTEPHQLGQDFSLLPLLIQLIVISEQLGGEDAAKNDRLACCSLLQVWYKANNIDNRITNLIPQSFMYLNGFVLI